MPIEFPQPKQGNPFDRWQWQWNYRRAPQQEWAPNLARPGLPFTSTTLAPGFWRPATVRPNLRQLGTMYRHGANSGSVVPPASGLTQSGASSGCYGGDGTKRVFVRVLGRLNMALTGVTRDGAGAALPTCRVLVFRTEDRSLVAETTSDGAGNYSIPLLAGGPFFVVSTLAGSPDKAGTTKDTLVPVQV